MSKELPLFKKIPGGYSPHKIQFWIIKQINYTHIYTCSHQHTKSKPQTKDKAMLGTSTDTTNLNPILSVLTRHMHFFISKINNQYNTDLCTCTEIHHMAALTTQPTKFLSLFLGIPFCISRDCHFLWEQTGKPVFFMFLCWIYRGNISVLPIMSIKQVSTTQDFP